MKKLIAPIILALLGAAILLALGAWQIKRLAWKEGLIAEISEEMARAPIELSKLDEIVNYAPVYFSGKVMDGHLDLLSGSKTGGAGYRRILPMQTEIGVVLVEMGFLPEARKEAAFDLKGRELEIQGHIFAPKADGKASFDAARNIWIGYDIEAMAKPFGAKAFIVVAQASPLDEWESQPMGVNLPNNHLQYAITWFSLAAVWCMMAAYWGYSRNQK